MNPIGRSDFLRAGTTNAPHHDFVINFAWDEDLNEKRPENRKPLNG
jgi:hypothetical protein